MCANTYGGMLYNLRKLFRETYYLMSNHGVRTGDCVRTVSGETDDEFTASTLPLPDLRCVTPLAKGPLHLTKKTFCFYTRTRTHTHTRKKSSTKSCIVIFLQKHL